MKLRPNYEYPLAPGALTPTENITDHHAVIDGWDRHWKEYVPSCYDGSKPVPLVVVLHGGGNPSMHYRTIWNDLAETENFIVVYPEAHYYGDKLKWEWNSWDKRGFAGGDDPMGQEFPNELNFFDGLMDLMEEKYNIDKSRIYMHGQSLGDMTSTYYTFYRGRRLAAVAPFSGPTFPRYLLDNTTGTFKTRPVASMPIMRTHGSADNMMTQAIPLEKNQYYKRELHINANNRIWRETNECRPVPFFATVDDKCFEFYPGKDDHDFIFYSVEGGPHGPGAAIAQMIWDYWFTRYVNIDGMPTKVTPKKEFKYDTISIGCAAGGSLAYKNGELISLSRKAYIGDTKEMTEEQKAYLASHNNTNNNDQVLLVPITALVDFFPGTKLSMSEDGQYAMLTYKGHSYEFCVGNRMMVRDGEFRDIKRVEIQDGELMVPLADLAQKIYGLIAVEKYNHTVYITDHIFQMTYDFAYTIRELCGTQKEASVAEIFRMLDEIPIAKK